MRGLTRDGNLPARDFQPRQRERRAAVGTREWAVEIIPSGHAERRVFRRSLHRAPRQAEWTRATFTAGRQAEQHATGFDPREDRGGKGQRVSRESLWIGCRDERCRSHQEDSMHSMNHQVDS